MTEPKRILVTAALPYANGPIHLGHLSGAYLPADIYVRYQRLRGKDIVFICGSDEHGVPITITADKQGTTPQAIVDRYHTMNKEAFRRFGMSFDNYSRTSLPLHHRTAQEFFVEFHKRGILREKQEKQFYDNEAGMFLPDRYVEGTCPVCSNPDARGDQCENCGTFLNPMELINPRSKITGKTPVVKETSHWYFPLGTYQKRLEDYIRAAGEKEEWKENVLQYCRGWFKDGLQDRAVTRDLDWGVRVPLKGYERKVIYVWFDAVLGYISSTREWAEQRGDPDAWKRYWNDPGTKYVAFIGKDNVVFHCIVFPAMLMAWNDGGKEQYVLPANVPANEFLNFEGQKFSKSRGWGIDVQDFLDRYPADTLRYYLAVSLPESRDSDFFWKEFQAKTNSELADILGNFINRALAFAVRTFDGVVPERGMINELEKTLLTVLERTPTAVGERFERYHFRDGVNEMMNLARAANKYFNDSEPWKSAKADRGRCATTINLSIQVARALAILASPVIPESARTIWKMLNLEGSPEDQTWESGAECPIPSGHRLGTPEILFTKIEDATIAKELSMLGQPDDGKTATAPVPEQATPLASIDDFKKLDLRVAKIVSAEPVPKSKKLLKLEVEVGAERRTIVAGIAQHYQPETLLGLSIVVVFNLQPATLMGQESRGMVLAASDESGKLLLVAPRGDIDSGSKVR